MPRFFIRANQIEDGVVTLLGDDAHHISRSLRMAAGECITVCDMQKNEYECELTDFLDRHPYDISGGEQQMLAMGRALMSRPKLLMLDEPSMGLAPILVGQIFDIIKELHEAGTTILLVEQNAEMALEIADSAYVIESGRVSNPHQALFVLFRFFLLLWVSLST